MNGTNTGIHKIFQRATVAKPRVQMMELRREESREQKHVKFQSLREMRDVERRSNRVGRENQRIRFACSILQWVYDIKIIKYQGKFCKIHVIKYKAGEHIETTIFELKIMLANYSSQIDPTIFESISSLFQTILISSTRVGSTHLHPPNHTFRNKKRCSYL